jgi:hypothetical protein
MIIGLLGFISSGKGTAGEILTEISFTPLSFAGSLKDSVSAIFGWPRNLLEGDTEESRDFRETVDLFWSKKFGKEVTPRYILQIFGTEVCRNNLLDNIWVDSLERKIYEHNNVVITDVRFDNEIDFIKSLGGVLIQIDRKETRPDWFHSIADLKKLEELQIHPSEYVWYGNDKIDYIIDNDSDLIDLEWKIYDIIDNCI